jgi:hypothetical protein
MEQTSGCEDRRRSLLLDGTDEEQWTATYVQSVNRKCTGRIQVLKTRAGKKKKKLRQVASVVP